MTLPSSLCRTLCKLAIQLKFIQWLWIKLCDVLNFSCKTHTDINILSDLLSYSLIHACSLLCDRQWLHKGLKALIHSWWIPSNISSTKWRLVRLEPSLGGAGGKQQNVPGPWNIQYIDLYADYLNVSIDQNLLFYHSIQCILQLNPWCCSVNSFHEHNIFYTKTKILKMSFTWSSL